MTDASVNRVRRDLAMLANRVAILTPVALIVSAVILVATR
jgi:hypothetical protein